MAAAEAEVLEELRGLRSRVPQLTGALAAGSDGLLIAQDTSGIAADRVAALTATVVGTALRMTDATGQSGFRELLVRSADGYVATYAAGRSTVLTLLAQDRVNVGRLHLEGRRAGFRIGLLLDSEPGTVARSVPAALPPAPVVAPGREESRAAAPGSAAGNPGKAAKKSASSGSAGRGPAKPPAGEPAGNARTARNPTPTSTQNSAGKPADGSTEASAKDRTPAKATPTRTKPARVPRTTRTTRTIPSARPTTEN